MTEPLTEPLTKPSATPQELGQMATQARLLRHNYLCDPYRPGYHFVVPEGVHAPVDPNGALFWNGRYHLCYIYQHEGQHCWGHISSLDLVHWRHHPPALVPGDGDDGIFSGGAFIDEHGVATLTYWRLGKPDGIAIATSTDPNLDTWTRHPANPVIPSTEFGWAEKDGAVYGTADPSQIWFHSGRYYLLTGNLLVLREFGEKGGMTEHLGDTLYLFVSDDLAHWEYLHPFYESRREWTLASEDDMCPDFFALPSSSEGGPASGKHMLLFISHTLGCQYYLGEYADDAFTPEQHGRMTFHDHGYFAPESLADDKGRRIMWAWLFDHRCEATKAASGWSGELSLPRLLWMGDDGSLRMRPADELAALRYNEQSVVEMVVPAGSVVWLQGIAGNSLELALTMNPGTASRCGLKVCCAPDGSEETLVCYDALEGSLSIDTRHSSLGEGLRAVESGPLALRQGEVLSLRVFIDKSIIEVYANDRQALVRRIYPTKPESVGVALFAEGGESSVPDLKCWQMMPSNPY